MTNAEIYYSNDDITNWACDVNPETGEMESNGGIEHEIEYQGKIYYIITSWDGEIIYEADKEAVPYEPEIEEE